VRTFWQAVLWAFSGVGIVGVSALVRKLVARRSRVLPPPAPRIVPPELCQLKDRARLLVVDDQPFEYKTALVQEGFKIRAVRDITSTSDIERGEFDVVLLDLHGVATSISDRQGIGALAQIKRASPAQMVIAYSAASWPVAEGRETEIADVVLDKARAAYPDFREAVVQLLIRSASIEHYLDVLDRLCTHALDHVLGRQVSEARDEASNALTRYVASGTREDLADLESSLKRRGLEEGRLPQLHSTANLARRRLSPWLK
jgi:hypothetical protein